MHARRRLLSGLLIVAILLLTATWLADMPPFEASEPVPDDTLVDDGLDATDEPPSDRTPDRRPGLGPADPPTRPEPPPAPPPSQPAEPAEVGPAEDDEEEPGTLEPLDKTVGGMDIMKAANKAVAWLRKKQARNGSWGDVRGAGSYGSLQPTTFAAGPTALTLYALRKAKVPLLDPSMRMGYRYLLKYHSNPASSMETSMVLLAVLATADGGKRSASGAQRQPKIPGKYRTWANRLVSRLVEQREARAWRYNLENRPQSLPAGGPEDTISTHLASLALLTAHGLGIRVKSSIWHDVLTYTSEQQKPRIVGAKPETLPRGFAYIYGHPVSDRGEPTGGATACGYATTAMAWYVLTTEGRRVAAWKQQNPTLALTTQSSIDDAQAWLEKHYTRFANPGKARGQKVNHHHWLWALETAMDLGRQKKLGAYGWYAEIATGLVERQRPDGSWRNDGTWEPADVLDTCFALLFLQRSARDVIPGSD